MSKTNDQAPAPTGPSDDSLVPTQHDTADFAPSVEPVQEPTPNELPEKYRGKSINDIVTMHQNAESELGRARNEVGTVRRLADELLGIRRSELQAPAAKPVRERLTTDALLEDPEAAVTSVIKAEAASRDQELLQRTSRLESELLLTRFEKKHPQFQETMESPQFIEWVQKSPYRARLAAGAINGDFAAADELFSLFGESIPSAPAGQPSSAAQARNAGLVRSGGSTAASGSSGNAGKKIWSRAELITMRINDPDKFDSLYKSEIEPAYREKRVK